MNVILSYFAVAVVVPKDYVELIKFPGSKSFWILFDS